MEFGAIVAAAVAAVNSILDIVDGFGRELSDSDRVRLKLEILKAISDRSSKIEADEAKENSVLNGG